MSNHDSRTSPETDDRKQRGVAFPWVFLAFLAIAGFFFFTEHRAHLMGALPFLLLALCPLMHVFHHRHGGHDERQHRRSNPDGAPEIDDRKTDVSSESSPASPARHQH